MFDAGLPDVEDRAVASCLHNIGSFPLSNNPEPIRRPAVTLILHPECHELHAPNRWTSRHAGLCKSGSRIR
jgi:hypothetical protein